MVLICFYASLQLPRQILRPFLLAGDTTIASRHQVIAWNTDLYEIAPFAPLIILCSPSYLPEKNNNSLTFPYNLYPHQQKNSLHPLFRKNKNSPSFWFYPRKSHPQPHSPQSYCATHGLAPPYSCKSRSTFSRTNNIGTHRVAPHYPASSHSRQSIDPPVDKQSADMNHSTRRLPVLQSRIHLLTDKQLVPHHHLPPSLPYKKRSNRLLQKTRENQYPLRYEFSRFSFHKNNTYYEQRH